jgi:hypothetical protein
LRTWFPLGHGVEHAQQVGGFCFRFDFTAQASGIATPR